MISAFPAVSGSALLRVAIATALTLLMHGAGAQDRPAENEGPARTRRKVSGGADRAAGSRRSISAAPVRIGARVLVSVVPPDEAARGCRRARHGDPHSDPPHRRQRLPLRPPFR